MRERGIAWRLLLPKKQGHFHHAESQAGDKIQGGWDEVKQELVTDDATSSHKESIIRRATRCNHVFVPISGLPHAMLGWKG